MNQLTTSRDMTFGEFKVRDGARLIAFEGRHLGKVSSRRPDSPRWTELQLFRTSGGSYVLEKLGMSIMLHVPGCPRILGEIPRFQDAYPGEDPDVGFEYDECVGAEYDFTRLLVEEPRYWATIATDPHEIVAALYRKRDGSRHLPRISIELLENVAAIDEAINAAYRVERIS
jgi:hypothetical protein